MKKYLNGEKIFGIVNNTLLVVLSCVMLYPIYYLFISAVSDPAQLRAATNAKEFILIPQGFTFDYFVEHLKDSTIWRAYGNTILYTVLGTALSLFLSITCAFVLSRKGLKLLKIITIIVVLTMWLKPGMIATYANIESLGLTGSIWGIIIPFAFTAYNVILLRTGFEGIPKDIDESAQIDGASHFRTLFSIYIPASVPSITTVALFYAIDRWNGYFWAENVLFDEELRPLQVIVKSTLSRLNTADPFVGAVSGYALIIIAILPMLLLFPFIQKFFKKGVMSGAVK